jgi:hypothetical protein
LQLVFSIFFYNIFFYNIFLFNFIIFIALRHWSHLSIHREVLMVSIKRYFTKYLHHTAKEVSIVLASPHELQKNPRH